MQMMPLVSTALIGLALAAPQAATLPKEIPMRHALGTFTVDVQPLAPSPAEGLARYSINKQIH